MAGLEQQIHKVQWQVSTPTANALIRDLQNLSLLVEITWQLRGRTYVFERYLNLFIS
jgi:hypothetical protein